MCDQGRRSSLWYSLPCVLPSIFLTHYQGLFLDSQSASVSNDWPPFYLFIQQQYVCHRTKRQKNRKIDHDISRGHLCPMHKRESKLKKKEWRSWTGSDRPPIGLCLGQINGRLRSRPKGRLSLILPNVSFLFLAPFSLLAKRPRYGGGGAADCIECQTETNARVYHWDISSNILLERECTHRHIPTQASTHSKSHTSPHRVSAVGKGGVPLSVLYSRAERERRTTWI